MKQIIFGAWLILSLMAPLYSMEDLSEKEPLCTEHIIVRGIRIELKNGTAYDILLNIDEHQPYVLLKPEEKYAINSDEVRSLKAGYVDYSNMTVTSRWQPIDIKKIEDSFWLTDVKAVIKSGYRNRLYVDDYLIATSKEEDQRMDTAQKWAHHLLENSRLAKRFLLIERTSKEELETLYQDVLKEINSGQWVDPGFTNLVRKYYIETIVKALQNIIIGIELELKNTTQYNMFIKIGKKPQFELRSGEICVLNTQDIRKMKVGYTVPSPSIGLSSRWTKIEIRELEKTYRQQAILMHLKRALNNNINVSSIEKKGDLLSLNNGFEPVSADDFDYHNYHIYQ